MKKYLSIILVAVVCLAMLSGCGSSDTASTDTPAAGSITLRVALGNASSWNDMATAFKEEIEEKTDGEIRVDLFPDNQLGGEREVVEAAQLGDIDIAMTATSPIASLVPDLYMFDAPYVFTSREQAYEILDGDIGDQILAVFASKGLQPLGGFGENGFRNLTTTNRRVTAPEDLQGLKIRVMENEVHISAWTAFGANPTPMSWAEVFTGLQQKTIDGQENPIEVIYNGGLAEVQQYLMLTEHVYNPMMMLMNLDAFNSLSAENQEILLTAAENAKQYQRSQARMYEQQLLAELRETDMEVVELSETEKQAFQALLGDTYELVKNSMEHPEFMDAILE